MAVVPGGARLWCCAAAPGGLGALLLLGLAPFGGASAAGAALLAAGGVVTVAEGVETLEDWRLLQRFGCSVGQGWLIGKMPAPQLPLWRKTHQPRLDGLRAPPAPSAQTGTTE